MKTQKQMKIKVPPIKELVRWHNKFGRILKPNERRTKLFGIDGKIVKYITRSEPKFVTLVNRDCFGKRLDDSLDYCIKTREDDSKSLFRLANLASNGGDTYLICAECDLVLGSNYPMIDSSYSSPNPRIRQILFKIDQRRSAQYNAFEMGTPIIGKDIIIPVIYYKILKRKFKELRDWQTNLDGLIGVVNAELESKLKGGKKNG